MNITICISTYGGREWETLAKERALPSAQEQNADEILVGHEDEGTIASVRNGLGAMAQGDWLCYLDADDTLAPGYLDAMRRAYEQAGGDDGTPRLLTPQVSYVRKNRPMRARFLDRGISLRDDNWLVVGTLVRKDLFMRVGGFCDYPHGFEDFSLWSKCWRVGAEIVKVEGAIYYAHMNPRSKHRAAWRDRRWQVETHLRVVAELDEWQRQLETV
jgi:hypothetical protein